MKKVIYKPSKKMKQTFRESVNHKYTLLQGAVRSGKSFVGNDIAIRDIQEMPSCKVLISGYSISSVARNVVSEWKEIIDPLNKGLFKLVKTEKDEHLKINWRGLQDKRFYIRGAGKEHDYKQIQGGTFGYWLVDEAVRHAESFTDMAISRLSLSYSKSLWTMNPDSPFHYIKKRFLDNEKLYKSGEFCKFTYYLRDNPSLTDQFIESLKEMYSGVFYDRYINSLWTLAEGVIFDFFEEKEPYVLSKNKLPVAEKYVVGIDYGTGNPTCFILFGINENTHPKIWAEKEYYFDSKKQQRQLTDSEYSKELSKFVNGIPISEIIVDPSASSFKLQLKRDGFLFIKDADNSVLDGIRTQANMLKTGEYSICKEGCTQTIFDYSGYLWDTKAQLKGEDKPIKERDHTKDVERYVLQTLYGKDTYNLEKLVTM